MKISCPQQRGSKTVEGIKTYTIQKKLKQLLVNEKKTYNYVYNPIDKYVYL